VRLIRLRAVIATALMVGVLAPAAIPATAAASTGWTCQTSEYSFLYYGMDPNGINTAYWTTTVYISATGCWSASQTQDILNAVSPGSATITRIATGPSPLYVTTNFWVNLQKQYSYTGWYLGFPVHTDTGVYALYPRVYLSPSSSTSVGAWTTSNSCNKTGGDDVTPCRSYPGTLVWRSLAKAA
jgi:hypothetical protein